MSSKQVTGELGEQIAADWLRQHAYQIISRNFRCGHCEIDIVAEKNSIVHFVEVKTLRSRRFGFPEEKITRKKMMNMLRAAELFLEKNSFAGRIQFDVFSLQLFRDHHHCLFIEDVYL